MSDDRPILRPASELSEDFKAIGDAIGESVRKLPSVKDSQPKKSRPILSVHARNKQNG